MCFLFIVVNLVPPLLGFFSKQFVLYSAIQSGYYFMAIIAIIVSVISASYYLKIIRVLHSEPEQLNVIKASQEPKNIFVGKEKYSNLNKLAPSYPNPSEENLNLLKPGGEKESPITINSIFSPTNFHSFMVSTLTLSILLFILKPSILLNSTQLLSLSLFNS